MNKARSFPAFFGGSSLLTVFAVLCLTVFALLALSTAAADERLGDASEAAVMGYYAADSAAEDTLAALRRGEKPGFVEENGGVYSWSVPISDSQSLMVEVALNGEEYTVLRWQAVSTAPWQADDSITVWDGEQKNNKEK